MWHDWYEIVREDPCYEAFLSGVGSCRLGRATLHLNVHISILLVYYGNIFPKPTAIPESNMLVTCPGFIVPASTAAISYILASPISY